MVGRYPLVYFLSPIWRVTQPGQLSRFAKPRVRATACVSSTLLSTMSRTNHKRPPRKRRKKCICGWAMCCLQRDILGPSLKEQKESKYKFKRRREGPIAQGEPPDL